MIIYFIINISVTLNPLYVSKFGTKLFHSSESRTLVVLLYLDSSYLPCDQVKTHNCFLLEQLRETESK